MECWMTRNTSTVSWLVEPIVKNLYFMYNNLMKSTRIITMLLLGLTVALTYGPPASAYFSPEEVLLNKDLFLPPTSRETRDRSERQARLSAERREREHKAAFEAQRPPEQFIQEEPTRAAMIDGIQVSGDDLALLRTLRLLTRVQDTQRVMRFGGEAFRSGAPLPLAPTGAGMALGGMTLVGAIMWTIRRAKMSEKMTKIEP